jgi:hypothetical protein
MSRWVMAFSCAAAAVGVAILFFLPTFPAFMLIDWIDAHTLDIFDSDIPAVVAFGVFFLLAIPASTLLLGLTIVVTSVLRRLLPRQHAVAGTDDRGDVGIAPVVAAAGGGSLFRAQPEILAEAGGDAGAGQQPE